MTQTKERGRLPGHSGPKPRAVFSNRLSRRITGWIAGPFIVASIAVAIQTNWMIAMPSAAAGLILAIVMRTSRTGETLICTDAGVTVVPGRQPGGASACTILWKEVASTRYVERSVSAGAHESTVGRFIVEGASGDTIEVTTLWRNFADIVALCDSRTAHLRYSWLPSHTAPSPDVLERAGAYSRVARFSAAYSHLPQI